MGYDDDECLICYLLGGGNTPTRESGTICLLCLHEMSLDGVSHRVAYALNANQSLVSPDLCQKKMDECDCDCYCPSMDHDDDCEMNECQKGNGSCHSNCEKCIYCERCLMGAMAVNVPVCGEHGNYEEQDPW